MRTFQDDPKRKAAKEEAERLIQSGQIKNDDDYDAFMASQGIKPLDAGAVDLRVPAAAAESTNARSFTRPQDRPSAALSGGDELRGAARSAAQGATFGFADEIEAGARAPFEHRPYTEVRDEIRGADKTYRAAEPKLAGALDIGGGLASMLIPAGSVVKGAAATGKAIGTGGKILRSALTGAGFAGLNAAGHSDEAGDMIPNAARAGATGAVLGAALPGAGAVIKPVARLTRDIGENMVGRHSLPRATSHATEKIYEAITRDGESPLSASTKMWQKEQAGFPAAVIDAGGKNLRNLGNTAYITPGPGSETLDKFVRGRSAGTAERLATGLEKTSGSRVENLNQLVRDISKDQSAKAKPLYEAAFSRSQAPNVPKEVWDEIQNPDISRGWAIGQRRARLDEPTSATWKKPILPLFKKGKDEAGRTINELVRAPTVQDFDWIKRGLDVGISKAKKKGDRDMVRLLSQSKERIIAPVKESVPEYAAALETWEGDARLKNMIAKGKKFLSMGDDDFADVLASARGDHEVEVLRRSAANTIAEQLRNKQGAGAAANVLANPKAQRRLSELFPDAKSFKHLQEIVGTEAEGHAVTRRLTGQSHTAENALHAFDFTNPPAIPTSARGGLSLVAQTIGRKARAGAGEAEAGEVARLLTQGGKEGQDWLDSLVDYALRQNKSKARNAYYTGMAAGSVGSKVAGGGR
jgi:hypothetical protein